jgi:hypothetical protein
VEAAAGGVLDAAQPALAADAGVDEGRSRHLVRWTVVDALFPQ